MLVSRHRALVIREYAHLEYLLQQDALSLLLLRLDLFEWLDSD